MNKSVSDPVILKPNQRMRGGAVLKILFLLPVVTVLVLLMVFAFYEGRKAYWDYRVQKMCEQDGGLTVFENIRVSAEDYERLKGTHGAIPIPERRSADSAAEYVSDTEITRMHQGTPDVWRTVAMVRSLDGNRPLARWVNYTRRGGDFLTVAHASYFTCDSDIASLSSEIFIVQGVEQ